MTSKARKNSLIAGKAAERAASAHIKKHGAYCIEQNFRCKFGEIDLIVEDGNTLVFVEVRLRKNSDYGSAVESVTPAKQAKLRITAQHYLAKRRIGDAKPVRFDVIGITAGDIQWIKDAF